MERSEYLFRIAGKVFPGLRTGKFFTVVNGTEQYFSGMLQKEVKLYYKSFYEEYDYAFSLQCIFSLCDRKTKVRWVRQPGTRHQYTSPALFVVERTDFHNAPEQIVKRMQTHYRANTLILDSYSHPRYSGRQLATILEMNGLNLIMRNELHPALFHAGRSNDELKLSPA